MARLSPQIVDIITAAARQHGVSPETLVQIAQTESGGNPNAGNPRSSAGGLFQFIDATADQYGLHNRYDPVQASDAAARLLRDNAAYLQKRLGRQPTAGELYLAHQQGAGGAANMLMNPAARASDLVGGQAISLNGGNPAMRASDFVNLWNGKFSRQQKDNDFMGGTNLLSQGRGGMAGGGGFPPAPRPVSAFEAARSGDWKSAVSKGAPGMQQILKGLGGLTGGSDDQTPMMPGQPAPLPQALPLNPIRPQQSGNSNALSRYLAQLAS